MWFVFGFITLTGFLASYIYRRLKAGWNGDKGVVDGKKFSYEETRSKLDVYGIRIGIDVESSFNFRLKEEKWYDRFFTWIGLAVEGQVGEDDFDKTVYIESDDSIFLRFLRKSDQARTDFLKLFNINHNSVSCTNEVRCSSKRLWVYYKTNGELNSEKIDEILKHVVPTLYSIKDDLVQIQTNQRTIKNRDPFIFRASILLTISTALVIAGYIHFLRVNFHNYVPFLVEEYSLFPMAITVAACVLLLFLILAVFLLGRSSRAHLVLLELFFVGGFGLTANSYTVIRDLNMEYDVSPEVVIEERVLSKDIHRGKTTSYSIDVRDWYYETGVKRIYIAHSLYDSIEIGSTIEFRQKDGYLGYKWITDMKKSRNQLD